jgi:hypothetical protein
MESRLSEAQYEVAMLQKECFLRLASSEVRRFWVGGATPEMLSLPQLRGDGPLTEQALARAEQTRGAFQRLEEAPARQAEALVERAFVDIVAGQLDTAEQRLAQARDLAGEIPAVNNATAVLYMTRGDRQSIQRAERLLRETAEEYPDYLPALYNLALVSASEEAWERYLQRETRPEYRRIAEEYLRLVRE